MVKGHTPHHQPLRDRSSLHLAKLLGITVVITILLSACSAAEAPSFVNGDVGGDVGANVSVDANAESSGTEGSGGSTNLLFWHEWQDEDAHALQQMLSEYKDINPGTNIVEFNLPAGTMRNEFIARFNEGTEADMILADWDTAQDLIHGGYIKDLTGLVDVSQFDEAALSTVAGSGKVYGLPLTMSTELIFYNKERVPDPPTTLDELTRLVAHPGYELGLNTGFLSAYWGIRLFGGRAYNADGSINLDRGAFINWLTTLRNIQRSSGFVLNDDQDQLRKSFVDGDIELYIGSARESVQLQAALGDNLGAVRLPVSANGNPSGPILQTAVLLLSSNASTSAVQRALDLAAFLTNPEQQTRFTQYPYGRLPANSLVRVSPSMDQVVVELAKQIRSAVPITLDQRVMWDKLTAQSQSLYRGVLEGVIDVYVGAADVERALDLEVGLTTEDVMSASTACPQLSSSAPLTLTLWHGWSAPETAVLQSLAEEFKALCPSIAIQTKLVPDNIELYRSYSESVPAGTGPDMLLDSTQFIATYAQDGLVRPLNDVIDPARLTQVVPTAVNSLRYHGQLYGYPENARSLALFYNPKLILHPPQTLDDLLLMVDLDHQFAMPLTFFYAFWGIEAFGGRLFDENNVAVLDQGGMVDWLEWLHDTATHPGFVFTAKRATAEDLFIEGKAAFLISGPWSLPRLYEAMPADEIRVALLPAGPADVAKPILEVEAFLFNPAIDDDKLQAGLAFARFVTGRANQQRLLATGMHVPANVTVNASQDPVISAFRDQTHATYPAVQDRSWDILLASGDSLYQETVLGNRPAVAAVAAFTKLVNDTNAKLAAGGTGAAEKNP
jgi:arabinogalactan oligomer / maltooligosaccharide transport system substrate-binding protein